MQKGKLFLIPTPLGEGMLQSIPAEVISIIHHTTIFIAEKAKTIRHFIKSTQPPYTISELTVFELNKRTEKREWETYLDIAIQGKNIGLMSEAGCPGVADPGAVIVALAHQKGIEVVPLVGPSSILLALMASGMNGQCFCFNGYLSPKRPQLAKDLKKLEQQSARLQQAQIFIETPYRNNALFEQALLSLSPTSRFCVAVDLTLPTQSIKTMKIQDWKKEKAPDLHKRPCIFLLQK